MPIRNNKPKQPALTTALSCLQFPSVVIANEFVRTASPYIVEELDTVLCGLFSDSQIALAKNRFQAKWWAKQP